MGELAPPKVLLPLLQTSRTYPASAETSAERMSASVSQRFVLYVHVKLELSSTPICIWSLFSLRGLMGQLGSECRVCFESDCCLPHFAPSLRDQSL